MDIQNILSGEQLVHSHVKTNHELPSGGIKEFQPCHSWLEEKQIQSALDQRKALLEEERIEKWSCLMGAEWKPDKCKAEVTQKGKPWEVFGHHSNNADWLFPEEVLFLMEMNCLECLFEGVPLSIQKGYTVLLKRENGCSLNEYRVFAHLCRTGYRVVRHLPELTVTAYERQIRLDQHIDQGKTNMDTNSEFDIPRPDLPPKKILTLPENTEISIESSNVVNNSPKVETPSIKKQVKIIEVIDLAVSSSEESSGDESSDDSDIEIINESVPPVKVTKNVECSVTNDDDIDIEIIEVPVPRKDIIVATIESSDSEQEKNSSDSESNRSYDGNWKRKQLNSQRQYYVRPASMSNFKCLAVEEFCVEKRLEKNQSTNNECNKLGDLNGETISLNSVTCISLDPRCLNRTRPIFIVDKTRNEILDLMPTMAEQGSKIMTLDSPDLRLIPYNIIPKQKSYTFNTNSLRARVFSFRQGYRGRRNFHGPRFFNSYNPFNNSINNSFYSNQFNIRNPLSNAPTLTQMFGSDIHSVARGMMQFASALLLNTPQNNQTNDLMSYNFQPNRSVFSSASFSQTNFSSHRPIDQSFPAQSCIQYHDSSFGSHSPINGNIQRIPRNMSFGIDQSSNSNIRANIDFESRDRIFTPPVLSNNRRKLYHNNQNNRHPPRPYSRNLLNQTGAFSPDRQNLQFNDSPAIDPAYIKSDIPLPEEHSVSPDTKEDFIPVKSTNQEPIEVINLLDSDDTVLPLRGVSNRFQRKRKRRMRQNKMKMTKRICRSKQTGNCTPPVIVFLDSPAGNSTPTDSGSVKVENSDDSNLNIKTEIRPEEHSTLKEEPSEGNIIATVKREQNEDNTVKTENDLEIREETTVKCEENNVVKVKVEQKNAGENIQVEIKIESSSDTSSVNSLPITSLVKLEPESNVKTELSNNSSTEIKIEPRGVDSDCIKSENPLEQSETKDGIVQNCIPALEEDVINCPEQYCQLEMGGNKENSQVELNNSTSKCSRLISRSCQSVELQKNKECSEMDMDVLDEVSDKSLNAKEDREMEVEVEDHAVDIPASKKESDKSNKLHKNLNKKESSWAEIKKHNVPFGSFQELQEDQDSSDEEDEIHPIIKPKHCTSVGTVLSALQIFHPFTPDVPEDISKLKISFDMYLPTEFRKSQRCLPQFRIVVFEEKDDLPSPAQLFELQTRFEDSVPILRAVVMPDSIVFYSCSSISLPVDVASSSE